jgi:subtilisin
MRRLALFTAGALVLAGCQDGSPPTAIDASDATLAQGARNVDVIVVLNESFAPGGHAANQGRAAEIARGLGVAPTHAYGTALFGFAASVPEGRLVALGSDPRVAYVDLYAPVRLPDHSLARPGGGGGSAAQVVPWGITRTGASTNGNTGAGIHVYVIDTGIDSRHPDLAANLGNGFAVESCKGGGCQHPWDDDQDHGTHVAGTVGAIDNGIDVVGVAPQVTLHAVKVLSKSGSGTRSGVIRGVDWVASETRTRGVATVANMSLGGSGSKTGTCTDSGFSGTDSYHAAICNAKNVGVVFVVAAGNDGANAAGTVPAAYDDAVITVSATTCAFTTSSSVQTCGAGSDDWTSWSNWGNQTASWTSRASAPVAIAAPGRGVLSTKRGGGTVSMSGTSMASPHAAGAAALVLKSGTQSANGTAFHNTRARLLSTAEATGGWSNTSGNPHAESFLRAGSL